MGLASDGISLGELAELLGAEVDGDSTVRITSLAGLQDARPGSLVRVEEARYLEAALETPCAALLLAASAPSVSRPSLRVPHVKRAFVRCLELFEPDESLPPGVHPTAVIGEGCSIDASASVGAYAVLGRRVSLAAGAAIHPHATLGDDASVGLDSVIFASVVLYPRTVVGARVRIHSGAVIGAEGFGYEWFGDHHHRIPQNGRVRIEDDVEIGANSTIDRATTGETVIGRGTKIDNLVQIAHNVRTGAHCVFASQVGIAGSTVVGNGVIMGGQSGARDHLTIADGVQAAARSGIMGPTAPNARISGFPDRPHREELRIQASLTRLPDLVKRVDRLEPDLRRRLEELERRLAELESGRPDR